MQYDCNIYVPLAGMIQRRLAAIFGPDSPNSTNGDQVRLFALESRDKQGTPSVAPGATVALKSHAKYFLKLRCSFNEDSANGMVAPCKGTYSFWFLLGRKL
jgi:hypothetical protein